VGTIVGTAVYLPFAAADLAKVEWAKVPWQGWAAIVYAGLVAIFLCFVIWYASVKEVGSAKTGVYSNLTPILAIFFAGLVLGERLAPIQAVGAAVTLAGVYLTRSGYRFFERRPGRRPAGSEDAGVGSV
jgi:drug/metabolite transporter (DMT)-like permease